jgi:uncharacterized phage-associated protein
MTRKGQTMPTMKFDGKKTKVLLAYIAGHTNIGKTKLMKLLYLMDFTMYERFGRSITGDTYRHWPQGPVPVMTWRGMKGEDNVKEFLTEESIPTSIGTTYIKYTPNRQPDTSAFTSEEKEIIDNILRSYGDMNQQQLVELVHSELPYLISAEDEEIPYFMALYRDYKKPSAKEIRKITSNKSLMRKLKQYYQESLGQLRDVQELAA